MTGIPTIFQSDKTFQPQSPDLVKGDHHWVDFVAHVTQFGQSGIPETLEHLKNLLEFETDSVKRSVLLAGIGRCAIREGHFLDGAKTLGLAWQQTHPEHNHERAFILLEMASFLVTMGVFDMALLLLDRIPHLTQSEYILKLANYYKLVHEMRGGNLEVKDSLETSMRYFENIGSTSTVAYHLKNIGNLERRHQHFDQAESRYQKAMEISTENDHPQITAALLHDMGMLRFHQKRKEEGFDFLQQAFSKADSQYTRSFSQSSIGFIHFSYKNWHSASEHFQRALDIAVKEGVFYQIHGNCYYLGSCYAEEGKRKLSGYFFRKGYRAAEELIKAGFPVQGDLLKAVRGYVKYMESLEDAVSDEQPDLSFALNKTLKEIRSIFQGGIIEEMVRRTGSARAAAKEMDMPERTLFNTRKRTQDLTKTGYPDYCRTFAENHPQKSWAEMNGIFEKEMLGYLFKSYGMHKKLLSEKLGISYTHTLKLTEGMDKQLMAVSVGS